MPLRRIMTLFAVVAVLGATTAAARADTLPTVGPWQATRNYLVSSIFQNQGLATVNTCSACRAS